MIQNKIDIDARSAIEFLPQAILWCSESKFFCLNQALRAWSSSQALTLNSILTQQELVDLFDLDVDVKNNLIIFFNKTVESNKNETLTTTLPNKKVLRWQWLQIGQCLMVEDVTDWHLKLSTLQTLSDTDPLTNLANRRRFERDFARLIAQGARNDQIGALILFDIDNLKAINDEWGHGVGDKVLAEFGFFAKPNIRPYECLARIGGDEFAIVTQHGGLKGVERVVAAMEAILDNILLPNSKPISASFGIALFNQVENKPKTIPTDQKKYQEEIYAMADRELYKAKIIKKKPR